jgi:hypothetical protein
MKLFPQYTIPFQAAGEFTERVGANENVPALREAGATLNDPNFLMAALHSVPPHAARAFVTKPPLEPEVYRGVDNGILIPNDFAIKNEAAAAQKAAYMENQRGLVTQEPLPPTIGQLTTKAAPDVAATTQGIATKQDTLRRGIENITAERAQEAESKSPYLTQLDQARHFCQTYVRKNHKCLWLAK